MHLDDFSSLPRSEEDFEECDRCAEVVEADSIRILNRQHLCPECFAEVRSEN